MLSQDINELITKSGFTPYEIERHAGISHTTIYSWLTGKAIPTVDNLERVLAAIGYRVCFEKIKAEEK